MWESGQCPQRAWCPAAVPALRLGTIRTSPPGREVPWIGEAPPSAGQRRAAGWRVSFCRCRLTASGRCLVLGPSRGCDGRLGGQC